MNNYEVMNMLSKLSKEDDKSNTKTLVTVGFVMLAGVAYYQFWRNTTTKKLLSGLTEEKDALNRMYDNLFFENQRLQQNQKNLQQTIEDLGREKQALIGKMKQQEGRDSMDKQ
jgi:FtsZ-binding cell division protein ZapB